MNNLQPHLCLDESVNARCALLPGDPKRLDAIKKHLENPRELAYNREFRSLIGEYLGVSVLAVSTGIGGTSAGIAVEELHNLGVESMIRIGSCGALQKGIGIGDLILVTGAVRDDGASKTYAPEIYPAVPDLELTLACREAAKALQYKMHTGVARSHDSFYTDDQKAIIAAWAKRGVLGCDMETAALFVIGRLRGIKTASILNNVVLSEGDTAEGINSYVDGENAAALGEEHEILTALEAFAKLYHR